MSSSVNKNNIPVQDIITPSNLGDRQPTNHAASNTVKSSRPSQDPPNSMPHGSRTGRGYRNKDRRDRNSDGPATQLGSSNIQEATSCLNGRNRGGRQTGARDGKHRQRNKTHKLLEGMSDLAVLDSDSIEVNSTETLPALESHRMRPDPRKMNISQLVNRRIDRGDQNRRYTANLQSRSAVHRRNHTSQFKDPNYFRKFSKQQFLQANCQFVVLDGYDYSIHRTDPDWPIDWNCIEEIKFKQCATTETICPICLESPIAAKITKCGHIYCWTCMLHYLSLSDEKSRPCPICFEFVYKNDLRSVVSHCFVNYSVETEIEMRLMIRRKGCILVEPFRKPGYELSSLEPQDFEYWSQDNLFVVNSDTVLSMIVQRERDELEVKLKSDKDEPEACFIDQAIKLLEERVQKLNQRVVKTDVESKKSNAQVDLDLVNSYLFYQCSDGQHIYLNPFSTKILCHEYKNLENCPQEIRARIIQMDWISMSEAWRKRFRYLGHLPLTCEFRLIEIDFEKSNLVSDATLKIFEDQIKNREKERERLRREERKRDKIIQVEQDRKIYGIQPSLKININNPDQFPSVSDERYLGLSIATDHTVNDGFFTSSDDEEANEDVAQVREPLLENENSNNVTSLETLNSNEAVSNVALSFRDIQLQEEAKESAIKNASQKSPWGVDKRAKNSTAQSGPSPSQSSFAQLLSDAKSSKKQWTAGNQSQLLSKKSTPQPGQLSFNQNHSAPSECDGEELRAPANLTISDFIDMSIVSKKKVKHKGPTKRI